MRWDKTIGDSGFAILPALFAHEYLNQLLHEIDESAPRRSRAGIRHALSLPPVTAVAREPQMIELARQVLGSEAFPFRATLFRSGLSVQEALTALLSKYIDCVIAIEQADLEIFFGNFIARSKVKDAVNALLAARELSFVHISGQSMLQITPEKVVTVPAPEPRHATRIRK